MYSEILSGIAKIKYLIKHWGSYDTMFVYAINPDTSSISTVWFLDSYYLAFIHLILTDVVIFSVGEFVVED